MYCQQSSRPPTKLYWHDIILCVFVSQRFAAFRTANLHSAYNNAAACTHAQQPVATVRDGSKLLPNRMMRTVLQITENQNPETTLLEM